LLSEVATAIEYSLASEQAGRFVEDFFAGLVIGASQYLHGKVPLTISSLDGTCSEAVCIGVHRLGRRRPVFFAHFPEGEIFNNKGE
jgi:hypothetical protein